MMHNANPLNAVILSKPERGTSEGESKDPENVSPAMPIQGISTRNLPHRSFRTLAPALICLVLAVCCAAQTPASAPAVEKPSISLSPAVIMARGNFGQSLTQTLTLTNNTGADLGFELVAQDVVVKDGTRIFVAAGETPNGIAASAVFSPKSLLIKAHTAGSVEVRLTIPEETNVRAVSAIFMGTDKFQTSNAGVAMTASLATLITFNLTDGIKLQSEGAVVKPASASENMKVEQVLNNAGTEPLLPEGTAAILDAKGALVGKATVPPQRLLPGERQQFVAEYPEPLPSGAYRVLCSFQFEGKTLTTQAEFKVP